MESRTVSYTLQARTLGEEQLKMMGDELSRVKVLLGEMGTQRAGMSAVTEELNRSATGARNVRAELDQIRQAGQASSASLVTALNDVSNKLDGLVGRERVVIQETIKLDSAVAAAARGVNTLGNMYARGAIGSTEFASKSAALRLALGGVTESAGFLSQEAALAERALKALAAAEGSAGATSPAAQRFKLEAAAAREAAQAINTERIAWQGGADQGAVLAGMAKREAAIRGTISSLAAEKEALLALGVPEQAQLKRIQELTALTNTYSIQLRAAVSVQNSINDVITRGSLGAGVRDGTSASNQAAASSTRSLTAETERLTAAEKLGLLTKKELSAALLTETTAHRTALTAIEAEMLALRQLGVLDVQQAQRLSTLVVEQDRYTAALLRSTTAQREAAQAGNLLRAGAMGAGASGKLNGAAMGLSFVSPELGMASMLLTMGPQIALIAGGFLAIGGAIKTVSSGMNDFADWNRQMTQLQALTHLSSESIASLSGYFRQLSTEIPVSAKELGELGRQAVLVGLHGEEGIRSYVASMSALSIVLRDVNGNSSGLEKVGQEIVKVLRSTGLTTEEVNAQFATTVDTLVALKTQFGINIPEVTNLAKFWSSYAASVGFSTEQIWAWSAALISVGARAQGAGGALTKILEKASGAAAAGGKEWQLWAQLVGKSSDAAKELLKNDPNAFLTAFATGMSNSSKAGIDMGMTLDGLHLSTAQVVRTVSEMAVALPSMTRAQQAAAAGARDHGLAMRTAKEAADNYKDKLITLGHTWDNFKMTLGAAFIPMANDVVSYLDNVLKRLNLVTAAISGMPTGDALPEWLKSTGLEGKMSPADEATAARLLAGRQLVQARLNQNVADPNADLNIRKALQESVDKFNAGLQQILQVYKGSATLPVPGPIFDKNGNPTTGQTILGNNNYIAPQNGASATSGGRIVAGTDMLRTALGLAGDRTGTPFGQKYFGNNIHNGEDIFAPTGTAVNAPFTGWLTKRWSESLGNVIDMVDAAGNKFSLGHLEKYGPGLVDAIDKTVDKRLMVQQGALVAYIGQTGNAAHKELGPENSHTHAMGWKADATNFNQMVSPFGVMYQGFNDPGAWGQKVAQPAAAGYSGESQKELDRNLQTTNALMDKAGDKASQYAGRLEHIRTSALNLAHAQSQGSDEWLKAMGTWSSANSALEKLNGTAGKGVATAANLRTYGDAALSKIKALEAATATGDPDKSTAAQRDLDSWVGKSKVKQAVLDAESAAYQTRKQNQQKADQDAGKAEQDRLTKAKAAAELQKTIASDLAASNVGAASSGLDKLKSNFNAQMALAKNNAAQRLALALSLGQGILGSEKAVLALQLKQDQSAADGKAKAQQAALTKLYSKGKEPADQKADIETTRLKTRADAQTKYDNAASAAFLAQQERINGAQVAVSAKNKQLADQQLETQKQVAQQMAALTKQQADDLVGLENNKLKTMQNSQKVQLDGAKGDAAARLKVFSETDKAIETQAIQAAAVQRQATINAAAEAQKQSVLGIPKGASAANVKRLKAGFQTSFDNVSTQADSTYALAVSEAEQKTLFDLEEANKAKLDEARRFADELSKLQISSAQATASRLKLINDAEIEAQGENLTKKLELTKKYSQDDFKRQALILQATKKAAKDAANLNLDKAPPEVVRARLGQADADYQRDYLKAQQDRAQAVEQAQKAVSDAAIKEKEDVANLQKSYRELTDGIQKKIEAGTFDDVARRDALQSFNDLTRQSDKLNLTQNAVVKSARAVTYAFIENGQAAQQLIQDSKTRIQQIHDQAEAEQSAADDAAANYPMLTGMLSELIAQDLDPRKSGFVKLLDELIAKGGQAADAAKYVKDNLDMIEADAGGQSLAAIQYRGKKAIEDANQRNAQGSPDDKIEASIAQDKADSLTARLIDQVFYVAIKDSDPKKLAENQWRRIVENAQQVMQSKNWDSMGAAGRADFNEHLAETLAQAISNETNPAQLQGLMDFANKQIKDGMFDGVSTGLKDGLQQAVADAGGYLTTLKGLVKDAATGITSVDGQIINDGKRGGTGGVGKVAKLPDNTFGQLSGAIFSNADQLKVDPAMVQVFTAGMQQARAESQLTDAQLQNLLALIGDITATAPEIKSWGEDAFTSWNDKLTTLTDGLRDGTTSQADFNKEALDAVVSLSKLADAADLHGSTDLASYYHKAAAGLVTMIKPAGDVSGVLATLADEVASETVIGLVKLQKQFDDGAISLEDFQKQALEAIPKLLALAKAADAAGRTDLGNTYREVAKELQGNTAGVSAGFFKLKDDLKSLSEGYKSGSTDLLAYVEGEIQLAQQADKAAAAAARAGNPELAKNYRDQAAAIRSQLGPLGSVVEALGKFSDYAKDAQQIFSLFGQDDWAKSAADVADGVGSTMQAVGGIGKVATGDLSGIKDIIFGALNAVNSFANAILNLDPKYKLWKKNLLEIAAIEQKNLGEKQVGNYINPYFDQLQTDIENRTRTANATVWQKIGWWAFGGAPKIMSDEAAKSLAKMSGLFNDYAGSLGDIFRGAVGDAFSSGDWGKASANFEKSFDQKVGNLMLGKLADMQLKALDLGADIADWAQAMDRGDYAAAAAVNARIKAKISSAMNSPELQAQISSIPGFGAGKAPVGSIAEKDSEISDLQEQLKNATSEAERQKIQAQIDARTKEREQMGAAPPPPAGSLAEKDAQISKLQDQWSKAVTDAERQKLKDQIDALTKQRGLMAGDEGPPAAGSVAAINAQISKLQDQWSKVTSDAQRKNLQDQIDALTRQRDDMSKTATSTTNTITDPSEERKRSQMLADYNAETDPTKRAALGKALLGLGAGGGPGNGVGSTITLAPGKQLDWEAEFNKFRDGQNIGMQAANIQLDAAKRQQDAAGTMIQAAGMFLLAVQGQGSSTPPGRGQF